MGLDNLISTSKSKAVASKVVTDRKVKKSPSLKMISKSEIEKERIAGYGFAI